MIKAVTINLQVEGFHCWKNAPEQVSFLKNRHRHIFHIRCVKEVDHSDRDVEIILFKREVLDYLNRNYGTPCEFGEMSCEHICEDLMEAYDLLEIEVNEDGENGGLVRKN